MGVTRTGALAISNYQLLSIYINQRGAVTYGVVGGRQSRGWKGRDSSAVRKREEEGSEGRTEMPVS